MSVGHLGLNHGSLHSYFCTRVHSSICKGPSINGKRWDGAGQLKYLSDLIMPGLIQWRRRGTEGADRPGQQSGRAGKKSGAAKLQSAPAARNTLCHWVWNVLYAYAMHNFEYFWRWNRRLGAKAPLFKSTHFGPHSLPQNPPKHTVRDRKIQIPHRIRFSCLWL